MMKSIYWRCVTVLTCWLGSFCSLQAGEAVVAPEVHGLPTKDSDFFGTQLLGFRMEELILSFSIILVTILFRGIIVKRTFSALDKWLQKDRFEGDHLILRAFQKPALTFLLLFGIYLSVIVLPLDHWFEELVEQAFRLSILVIFTWGLMRVTDALAYFIGSKIKDKRSTLYGFVPLIRKSINITIVLIGALLVVDNLGYSIGGIIATLGLGGAAFAFAAKDSIANFYGSLALVLDRPFKVGDWIQVGDKLDGNVEALGLRSTRVRTFPKTLLSIPNNVLANETIINWSRMPKRRVKQFVGISYDTDPDTVALIVEDIRTLLKEDESIQQEFILVNFTDFGDSSLDILVYYFTKTIEWLEHMDVRQRINIKIMKAIKARGATIAFPSRSLYLEGSVAHKLAGMSYPAGDDSMGPI